MKKNILCKKDDIKPGEKRVFQVNRTSIIVVRKDDKFYALRNACPHQGAELISGPLRGEAKSDTVKKYEKYDKKGEVLICPWHHWGFDIESGCAVYGKDQKIKTYDVKVEGDDLVLYA